MANRVSDEDLRKTYEAILACGSQAAASRETGLSPTAVRNRMKSAEKRLGLGPPPPAFGGVPRLSAEAFRDAHEAMLRHGNITTAAREMGIDRATLRHRLKVSEERPEASGRIHSFKTHKRPLPKISQRYILTSAQNNTKINKPVWENLLALAKHYKAEILISRYTYNKSAYQAAPSKPGTGDDEDDLWYAPEILPYVCDDRIHLAPGLDFCGEMNTLPTATNPLSGLQSYTGRASGIFPHAKIAMESIASGKYEATKFNYTTGTVTQRNYIAKKQGQKAEFHHAYGGLLVEVGPKGNWFCRQLNADKKGTIHDLRIKVEGGKIKTGEVEAITWGDIHSARLDAAVRSLVWAKNGILDMLRPQHQFFHDLVDFRARNHHNRDCHSMFERYIEGEDNVKEELTNCSDFLWEANRDWCTSIVVDSNHDNALLRWLREADYKTDPVNAVFFLRCQAEVYDALSKSNKNFHLVEWALNQLECPLLTRFLREDESFVIKDIEMGMHGDRGPNGSRGTPFGFAKMGRKCNVGHTHQAGIKDGVYTAGHSGVRDMGYNKGPSSWSHSFILTFSNGKRQIITIWNGEWKI